MPSIAEKVIQAAAQAAPNSAVIQAAKLTLDTVENPSPSNILADVELAWTIISAIKSRLDASHESLWTALKEWL